MKSLVKRLFFLPVISWLFFYAFLETVVILPESFAKTNIEVNVDTCEIRVMLHKEFYFITPAARNREIQQLDNDINQLDQWLQDAKADLDAGNSFEGMDMAVSQQNYEAGKKDRQDLADRKKELEEANVQEAALMPGMTPGSKNYMIQKWDRLVESTWDGATPYIYDCCRVRFLYNYRMRNENDSPTPGYDQVGLHISMTYRSSVSGFDNGFDSDGFSNDPFDHDLSAQFGLYDQHEGMFAHEAGHEMGLKDRYVDEKQADGSIRAKVEEGYENDLLASLDGKPVSTGNNGLKVDNIATILTKRNISCPVMPCCPPPREPVPEPVSEPPPKTPEVSREPIEDPTGPIIVIGCYEGQIQVRLFTPDGLPLGFIDKSDIEADGSILHEQLSAIIQFRRGKRFVPHSAGAAGVRQGPDDSVTVLKKDLSDEEIKGIADTLKDRVLKSEGCQKEKDFLRETPGVDFIDKILERDAQEDIVPNDPFYWDKNKPVFTSNIASKITSAPRGSGIYAGKEVGSLNDQWGMHAIGLMLLSDPDSAWHKVDADKKNTVVAIIDSGLDMTHPDGPKYLWVNDKEIPDNNKDDDSNGYIDDIHGWNFYDGNNDLTDYKGHGTFVTGIVAAQFNNGLAIAGVNPGAQIMVLKVAKKDGKADNFSIYRAICYAANHGARVINISLAGKGFSELEQRGIAYAHKKGCVVVIAAGNQSGNILEYGPPASRGAFCVSAAGPLKERIWFSNIGANVALTAPGKNIFSLYSRDSEWKGPAQKKKNLCFAQDGTSFAAPFVAGVASLLFAKDPQLTNSDVEDILLDSATDMENKGWDQYTGAGLLNASLALASLKKQRLAVRFTDIVFEKDKKGNLVSVAFFGVVRGNLANYKVELAKGKKQPTGWETIFESAQLTDESGFLCRIDAKKIERGQDWTVRITGQDKEGNKKTADLWFVLKK